MTFTALVLGGIMSWLLTGGVRRYALSRSVLDIPNHRSSHTDPTPRGGGLAIGAVILVGTAVAGVGGVVPADVAMALVGGGAMVGAAGWIDDRRGLPARWRALTHLSASLWAVLWLGGLPSLELGFTTLRLGPAGTVLAVIGIAWAINLFNFMDGIDGIAAGEAISVAAIGGVLLALSGESGLASIALLVSTACAGFLIWNWQPAKIFMGDVGSGLLGFLFGALAVGSENTGGVPLLVWVLLAGVFVFDATITLLRRIRRGERWYDAHRSHAYQRAVRAGWSHARVTSGILLVNVGLGVISVLVWLHPTWLLPGLACAAVGLGWCYLRVERILSM